MLEEHNKKKFSYSEFDFTYERDQLHLYKKACKFWNERSSSNDYGRKAMSMVGKTNENMMVMFCSMEANLHIQHFNKMIENRSFVSGNTSKLNNEKSKLLLEKEGLKKSCQELKRTRFSDQAQKYCII